MKPPILFAVFFLSINSFANASLTDTCERLYSGAWAQQCKKSRTSVEKAEACYRAFDDSTVWSGTADPFRIRCNKSRASVSKVKQCSERNSDSATWTINCIE